MRPFLAILLLVALAFSGCAGKDKGNDADDGDASGTSSGSSSQSGTSTKSGSSTKTGSTSTQTSSGTPANHPPTGTIAATVNGTAVQFVLTGSDTDNDPLTWTLAFGDGAKQEGNTLPGNATHIFAVGNYTAFYNVTDGHATTSYNVSFTVAASAAEAFVITATYKGVDPAAVPPVGNPARQPSCTLGDPTTPGTGPIGGNWHVYDRDLTGWTFSITPAKFVAIFYQDDGTTRTGTFGSTGVVPAASVEVDICTADPSAGGSYTFTALPP